MTLNPEAKRNVPLIDKWQTEGVPGGTKSSVPSRQPEA